MCLKLYHTWTFSNSDAFRQMKYKLEKPEYLRFACPFAVVYVIKKYPKEASTPEKRDRLAYKELKALSEISTLRVDPYFFNGCTWGKFKKFLKQIPEGADVFGKVVLEMM